MQETPSPPVFIVGAARSGSTLFWLMLDHHPDIGFVTMGEFNFAVAMVGDDGSRPAIADYAEFVSTDYGAFMANHQVDQDASYDDNVARELAEACGRAGARVPGASVHEHFSRLPHLFPDARYIHLIRDGRDVARSCIGMGWADDLWHASSRWEHAHLEWLRLCESVPAERRMELHYESLVNEPRGPLAEVCRFLGLPEAVDAMLSYPETSDYALPQPGSVGAWRTMDDHDIRLAEARIGTLLGAYGYEPSGLPPLEPGRLELKKLETRQRLVLLRRRFAERGASGALAELVGRRVGIGPLERWGSERMNVALARNLKRSSHDHLAPVPTDRRTDTNLSSPRAS